MRESVSESMSERVVIIPDDLSPPVLEVVLEASVAVIIPDDLLHAVLEVILVVAVAVIIPDDLSPAVLEVVLEAFDYLTISKRVS